MDAPASMDQRTAELEKAMRLAATNAEFYLPLKEVIVIPELCAGLIALADEVRRLRKFREQDATQIRRLQNTIETLQEQTDERSP